MIVGRRGSGRAQIESRWCDRCPSVPGQDTKPQIAPNVMYDRGSAARMHCMNRSVCEGHNSTIKHGVIIENRKALHEHTAFVLSVTLSWVRSSMGSDWFRLFYSSRLFILEHWSPWKASVTLYVVCTDCASLPQGQWRVTSLLLGGGKRDRRSLCLQVESLQILWLVEHHFLHTVRL